MCKQTRQCLNPSYHYCYADGWEGTANLPESTFPNRAGGFFSRAQVDRGGESKKSKMPRPIPKPTRLKMLAGNPGKRPLRPNNEPQAAFGLPRCPKQLKGHARRAWQFLSDRLAEMNMDHMVDAMTLEGACVAYKRAMEADEVIDREGATFKLGNGYVQQRPEVAMSQTNWKLFKSFCAEFGFSPAARARLSINVAKDNSDNPFAQLRRDGEELQEMLSKPRVPRFPPIHQ